MTNTSLPRLIRLLSRQTVVLLTTFLLCYGPLAAQSPSTSADAQLERLQTEIVRLAELAGGKVGVSAIHLETGRSVYVNPSEPFPMASTYKVPMAARLLQLVDQGQTSLSQMVVIEESALHPGSGMITPLLDDPGVVLSLHNLLELMLIISDNSATDLVLQAAGGPGAVTARMRELGIEDIRVDRPTIQVIADWVGIEKLPPEEEWSPQLFRELFERYRALPDEERREAAAAFNADPRDTSTPEAMARLLEKLWRGEILTQNSTELLLDIMRRCQTGPDRIKGFLPPGIEVTHKTGTIGGTTNDVGIVTLPDQAGHVVVAVFVKESELDVPQRERAIAQISRAIYDFFLFNPTGK